MDDYEALSEFDRGQIDMARQLGASVAETAKLVGCSREAVEKAYREWSEEQAVALMEEDGMSGESDGECEPAPKQEEGDAGCESAKAAPKEEYDASLGETETPECTVGINTPVEGE